MYSMHVGCHEQCSQCAIKPLWKGKVCVIKHRARVQNYLKQDNRDNAWPQQECEREFVKRRGRNLDWVEPQSARSVQIAIGVMNAMKSPEDWNFMAYQVLEPDREIERYDGYYGCNQDRQVEEVENPPTELGAQTSSGRHREERSGEC